MNESKLKKRKKRMTVREMMIDHYETLIEEKKAFIRKHREEIKRIKKLKD